MEFHISRAIREKFDLTDLLFSYTGNVVFANVAASRKLAQHLNEARDEKDTLKDTVHGAALFAMGLIDELTHVMVARYRKHVDPAVLTEALRWFEKQVGAEELQKLLLTFTVRFPNIDIFNGKLTARAWLSATTDSLPNREAAIEELFLLWLANINPAFAPFRELFADEVLEEKTAYKVAVATFSDYFITRPPVNAEVGSLLEALRAPMLASPDSLSGQLDFIREHWVEYLGEDVRRALLAIDVLREEDIAIWMRFNPPEPDNHRHGEQKWGAHGFVGDEYIGFEDDYVTNEYGVRRRRYASDHQAPLNEYEAFSPDQAWMPTVVLIAKSTYVWLEQLSKKYGSHIHKLEQIPDDELRLLAERGISSLWLIGLWERSVASQTIKRLRGHSDAVASAYSLKEYHVADDLGGNHGYENLRDRAAVFGLRLASDMVPNHMGIDSTWVVENPDWFIWRNESPFPSYTFNGPDLSVDSRVEIKIEDHYFDQTDAAVAFRLRHHRDGHTRYMYHGNDGTTFAWNDTAQLDYSKVAVREHVIQTILHVARLFPIIRFDAAMTLAKRHVQRLWFPLPGVGGSIPSRAEDAIPQEKFDELMPSEFWREVVDRVAAEVPGTLLLAEAFWMLEGYFVRTLGMHRVYNSAFMNMLRDEENAKYRSYLKKTIEFDSDILKRYVNFMSNPDERTTIDQFGSGDKCFGVATLMCTLPGLPMFGHGQIEGFTERYGMEYKRAKMEEWSNDELVARHQREIAPLLRNRQLFAESTNFVLYDFWNGSDSVDENVFAYSNRSGEERAIVLYNNTYGSTHGTIHHSVSYMDKGSGHLRSKTLSEALAATGGEGLVIGYRDTVQSLDFLLRARELRDQGLTIPLRGYQYAVLQDWRELWPSQEHPWDQLCDILSGSGVPNLGQALVKLKVQSVHQAFRKALTPETIKAFADVATQRIPEMVATTFEGTKAPPDTDENLQKDSAVAVDPEVARDAVSLEGEREAQHELSEVDDLLHPFVAAAKHFVKETKRHIHAYSPAEISYPSGENPSVQTLVLEAIKLPTLAATFSSDWPACVDICLPGAHKSQLPERVWSPVVAWTLLRGITHEDVRVMLTTGLLREMMAETFAALGIEGEASWRMAATVLAVLSRSDRSSANRINSEKFWQDEDIRWLAGVHEAAGITYVGKEQFEELLCWLQLPVLTEATGLAQPRLLENIERDIAMTRNSMAMAGYDLTKFLSSSKDAELAMTSAVATDSNADQSR